MTHDDDHKAKMKPVTGSPPGIELDGKAHVIPLAERTAEDRAAALSGAKEAAGGKDPEGDAKNPASMPREQQGQNPAKKKSDPAGQQGGG